MTHFEQYKSLLFLPVIDSFIRYLNITGANGVQEIRLTNNEFEELEKVTSWLDHESELQADNFNEGREGVLMYPNNHKAYLTDSEPFLAIDGFVFKIKI